MSDDYLDLEQLPQEFLGLFADDPTLVSHIQALAKEHIDGKSRAPLSRSQFISILDEYFAPTDGTKVAIEPRINLIAAQPARQIVPYFESVLSVKSNRS